MITMNDDKIIQQYGSDKMKTAWTQIQENRANRKQLQVKALLLDLQLKILKLKAKLLK